jgi:MtrB/PioB family decaheme-associated outer membrane protein
MRTTVFVSLLVGLMCRPAPAAAQAPVPSSGTSQSDSQQATAPAAPQTTPAAPQTAPAAPQTTPAAPRNPPAAPQKPAAAPQATPAAPQKPAAAPQAAPAATDVGTTTSGSFDFGGRGTTYTGDPARYNEFRDMSNGLFLDNFGTAIQKSGWFMDVNGNNAGRKDAFYAGEAVRPGRVKIWGSFSQVPWLLSDTTKTLYQGVGTGTLTIPNYVQSLLQTTASQIGAVAATATPFDLSSGRKYSTGGLQLTPNTDTTVTVDVNHMDRTGEIVGGGSFGFSAADELPIPVNQHQTDADAGIERTVGDWLFRVGYNSSWFRNDNQSLAWDNPYQLTDTKTLPGVGEMALSPNSFMQTVNGSASIKLPMHTRLTGTLSFGSLTDNTTLLPESTNTALPTYGLNRTTSEGDGRTVSGNFIFTSRPIRALDLDVRYRYYDYDDETPVATQVGGRIDYDSTNEVAPLTPPNATMPFGLASQTVDASANVDLGFGEVGAAYSLDDSTYTNRLFQGSVTNAERVTFDTTGNHWLILHGRYEHSERVGNGFNNSFLNAIGEQPTLETYDIANMTEDVGTLTGSILLSGSLSVNLSAGDGKDTYPDNSSATGFGLANAQYKTYGIGFAAAPTDNISFTASYDLNVYQTLQNSRSASTTAQFTNPAFDWSANGNDRTNSVLADLDVKNLIGKLRLKVTGDFNKGSTLYLYGLAPVTSLPAVSQLPSVMSELRRVTIDLSYPLSTRTTVGLAYWYEQFLVSDFAQDGNAIPTLNIPSLLTLGNVLLPYTAQTVFARVTYHW